MKRFSRILVAQDTRLESHPVVDLAARVARSNASTITLVDALPSISWLARITGDVERLQQATREGMTAKLEAIAEPLRASGLEVDCKLLEGVAWFAIVKEAKEGEHDLVMAVSKGDDSGVRGFFGRTARRLLRQCPVPLWIVPPDAPTEIRHVVACVDTSSDGVDAELNERIYQLATSISTDADARLSVLHAWEMEDEAILSARLKPETVQKYKDEHLAHRKDLLDRFLRPYGASVEDDGVHLINQPPTAAVGRFCDANAVDVVVMGTVARSGLRGLLMGNTAESMLDRIATGVLAVKPHGFRSPLS